MPESVESNALPLWYRAATGAERLMQVGRYDLAEQELRRALVQQPDDPVLHISLGLALEHLQRHEEARVEAQTALALNPQSVGAMALLSDLDMQAGRHRQAEAHLLAALRLEPQHPGLLLSYAYLMLRVGQLDKGEKLVRSALRVDPQHSGAHQLLGLLLAERRQHRAAEVHGGIGVRLAPDTDHSHAALGTTYLMGGSPFKARRHLRAALRIDPTDSNVQEVFHSADKACRWTYLPLYYWSLLVQRIPGKQFAVWAGFIAALTLMRSLNLSDDVIMLLVLPYGLFCIYTWLAEPLTSMWIRMRPPR